MTLSWSDPTGAATGFKVERRAGNQPFNEIATLAAGETVYTDTTLTQNTRYTYRVRATNAGGASPYSTEASGLTVPSAPSELAAVVTGAGRLRLTWANSSGSDVGFKLERRIGSGAFTQIATLGPGTTAYNDSGLASGASVTYRLRSFNQGGGSSFSNEAQATLAESLAAVSFGVESLRGGARVQGTVALTGPARQTITVALSSSDPKIATVPGSVTIAKGKTRATFTLRTKRVRTDGAVVTVTARATGTSRSAELEVTRGR